MITVVTSLTGGKDNLIEKQTKGDAKWLALVDESVLPISNTWQIEPAYGLFKSARRNSRVPKILIHQFVDTDYSLWIDANVQLLKPPEELVAKYLDGYDIALFRHPDRDCIYDEAMICATAHLDDPETIIEQVRKYEKDGYAKHRGLCENNFILRRHNKKIEALNNAWWAEYCRHSVRDQLSLMYVADKLGIRINIIDEPLVSKDGCLYKGDIIKLNPHLTARPEPQ